MQISQTIARKQILIIDISVFRLSFSLLCTNYHKIFLKYLYRDSCRSTKYIGIFTQHPRWVYMHGFNSWPSAGEGENQFFSRSRKKSLVDGAVGCWSWVLHGSGWGRKWVGNGREEEEVFAGGISMSNGEWHVGQL